LQLPCEPPPQQTAAMGCGASKDSPPQSVAVDAAPAKQEAVKAAPQAEAKPYSAAPAKQAEATADYKPGSAEPVSAPYQMGTRRKTATVRRVAISDEAIGGATQKAEPLKVFPKTQEVKDQLAAALKKHPLFEYLQDAVVPSVIDSMEEIKTAAGTAIITQGDPGDHFYIVASGLFEAFIKAAGDEPCQEYAESECFGELALLYNSPRAATVICKQEGVCYALERRTFRNLVMSHNVQSKHGLSSYLSQVPVLANVNEEDLEVLAQASEVVTYTDGEYIIQIGAEAEALFLVLSGEVVCHKGDGQELMRLTEGRFFGESAVSDAGAHKREANVVAVGPVRCAMIKASALRQQLGCHITDLMNRNLNKKILESVELLNSLDGHEREGLLDALKSADFEAGAQIVSQGAQGTNFYIVKSGVGSITKDGVEVKRVTSGDFFGERALLTEEPVSATVTAIEPLSLMTLRKEEFESLLGPLQTLLEREVARREASEQFQKLKANIRWEDLDVMTILGEGSFGRVKLTLHKPTDDVYALKCLRKGQIIKYQQVDHVVGEKQVLALCNHPFLLKLAAVFNHGPVIYMLLEYLPGGELFSYLRAQVRFEESTAALYAAMVTSAFGYLHARKIAHRDLKPENLLFDSEGYLKLVDMGFAKVIKDRTWTLCGTPEYLAPEIISNKGHNWGADWWTLGILAYEMLVGHPPFVAEHQVDTYNKIMRGKYKIPQNFPRDAKDMISKLLVHQPNGRLGCWRNGTREVMGHPFFKGIEWTRLELKKLQMPYKPLLKDKFDTSNFDTYPDEDNSGWDTYIDHSLESVWQSEFSGC